MINIKLTDNGEGFTKRNSEYFEKLDANSDRCEVGLYIFCLVGC